MKKLLLMLMVSLSAQAMFGQTESFTLKEAINYAIANDQSIKNAQLNVLDAEQQTKELLAFGLPQLNASLDYQFFGVIPTVLLPSELAGLPPGDFVKAQFGTKNNIAAGLSASWLAFSGSYLVSKEASILYKDLVSLQVKQVEREVAEKVANAYVNTLIFDHTKKTFEKNIENLNQLIFETNETYKAGFVEELDVDRLKLSLQTLQNELAKLLNQEKVVKNALKFAMSFPSDMDLVIADDIDRLLAGEFTAQSDEELNLNNRPEMAVLDKSIELNEIDIKRLQKSYLPTVSLFANYDQTVTGNKIKDFVTFPTVVMGVKVQAPIFDGFEKKAKIERAKIATVLATNQKDEVIRGIRFQVEMARSAYKNAYEHLENVKKNIALAEKIQATTRAKFKEGIGSSFEMIQAESDLYQAQNVYAQALYDYMKAKSDFQIALGK